MSRRLLLTGVPGAGKTTLANYLEVEHGFDHVDMELNGFELRDQIREVGAPAFLGSLMLGDRNVVMSWGFSARNDVESIRYLAGEGGFEHFWLDDGGGRVDSCASFMRRENNDPEKQIGYHYQMMHILQSDIIELLKPTIVNPFDGDGNFRPVHEVAGEILGVG